MSGDSTSGGEARVWLARPMPWVAAGLVAVLVVAGCQRAEESAPHEAALKERAVAIAREGFQELTSQVMAAMARSGLTGAVPYCSEQALPITRAVAEKHGVELKRISHKPRNPANRATDAEMALLRQFEAEVRAGRTPEPVVSRGDKVVSVYVPIAIPNALCLMCHGRPGVEVSNDLLTTIRRLYPADEATGFAVGDLRGAWRVDFRAGDGRGP